MVKATKMMAFTILKVDVNTLFWVVYNVFIPGY